MSLHPDWSKILRHAWSIRLMLLAGILSALEVMAPGITEMLHLTPRRAAAVTGILVGAAFIARLVAQSSITPGVSNDK